MNVKRAIIVAYALFLLLVGGAATLLSGQVSAAPSLVQEVRGAPPLPDFLSFPVEASAPLTPSLPPMSTPTYTPSRTATVCPLSNYTVTTGTATIEPGGADIGNHCDDCYTQIALPFPYTLYETSFTQVEVDSNGKAHFPSGQSIFGGPCLPIVGPYIVFPYWDDLRTDSPGSGIFTSTTGTAPNRIFNIEWRTTYFTGPGSANFELRLFEGQTRFDVIYGTVSQGNTSATAGVQRNGSRYTQYFCSGQGGQASGSTTYTLQPGGCPATPTAGPSTSTPTPTPCGTQACTFVPGVLDTGNHCDDCVSPITLPFAFPFYGQAYTSANVSSNGNLQFTTGNPGPNLTCLPASGFGATIFVHGDDMRTDCSGCGIYTSVSGSIPNRIFNIEWRAGYFSGAGSANFEIRLHEGSWLMQMVYGQVSNMGSGALVGTQNHNGTQFWQYSCGERNLYEGLCVSPSMPPCGTGTPTPVPTSVPPTATRVATAPLPTSTSGAFCPVTATGASTSCSPPSTYNYSFQFNATCGISGNATIRFEVAPGSGGPWTTYDTRTFKVNFNTGANTVQGGLIESGIPSQYGWYRFTFSAVMDDGLTTTSTTPATPLCNTGGNTSTPTRTTAPTQTPGGPTATVEPTPTACTVQFADVPSEHTFYPFVRCLACQGIIGGYPCGGAGEPCNAANDPYFRPNNNITRGQLAKIVSESAGFSEPAGGQIYEDVPPASPFYLWINRLSNRGVMGGYPCGVDPNEPCGPGNRPYFRPSANATRGQLAKIVSEAAGFEEQHTSQTFEDVPLSNTFYIWVERLVSRQIMGGYVCGSVGEPCNPPGNRPYFRWGNTVTRGQASKIVANTFFPGCQTP